MRPYYIFHSGLLVTYLQRFYKGFFIQNTDFTSFSIKIKVIEGFKDTSVTQSTIILLVIKLMKNYITFFDISTSIDASSFINTERAKQERKGCTYFCHLTHFLDQKVGAIGRRLEKWNQAKFICKK